uniref:Heat shock transcription factor 4 n=1 Tax=Neolamprologus brichardi TaxID=32507 RepID=A0A3Q4HV45_NEOBR
MQESPGAVGVDGSYTSNVPAFLTKLWTLVEDPDTNHLICWSAVSHIYINITEVNMVVNIEQSGLVKPERDDTEFQHLYFLQGHEHMLEHIKRKVSIVKSEETKNEVLWREVVSLRQNHTQQQKVMNKHRFLGWSVSPQTTIQPLMLDDGSPSPPASKFSHSHQMEAIHEPFYIQSVRTTHLQSAQTALVATCSQISSEVNSWPS